MLKLFFPHCLVCNVTCILKPLNSYSNTKNNVVKLNNTENPKITSLDLSKATNLTTIGDSSFSDLEITSVKFGDNSKVSTIGKNAFTCCTALKSVDLKNVEIIDGGAFESCGLIEVFIPKTVKQLGA